LKGEDADRIKSASEALATASHKLAEQIYATSDQASSGGAGPTGGSSEDDVVDAEIVEEGAS
jgi:molecular chaperone DnaK